MGGLKARQGMDVMTGRMEKFDMCLIARAV